MFFKENPYGKRRRGDKVDVSPAAVGEFRALDFLTAEDFRYTPGSEMLWDIEVYPNLFFVGFKHVKTGKVFSFEISDENPRLDVDGLLWVLYAHEIVGFNTDRYDLPVLAVGAATQDLHAIKHASDLIILDEYSPGKIESEFNVKVPQRLNSVDVKEVAPLHASLKTYAARLHCQRMQDLPFNPHEPLTLDQATIIRHYCINDLDNTGLLHDKLRPQLDLRKAMSRLFGGADLRSKSDAQLAQEIICSELQKVTGYYPRRPGNKAGMTFHYKAPSYVRFMENPELIALLDRLQTTAFTVGDSGHVQAPDWLMKDNPHTNNTVTIAGKPYTVGLGGLHSNEKCQAVVSDDKTTIRDRDVTGYYPNLILKNKFAPEHLGDAFLIALQAIVDKRTAAKKAKEMVTADSLKIASNGTFGKLSDPFSPLYDPRMMVATTFTGQLSLLMAIERLEYLGIPVVSANTDGIVIACPRDKYDLMVETFKQWEAITGLETEETEYKALYSRDVNNYIAIKGKGDETAKFLDERLGCKTKGTYCERGSALNSVLSKNPEHFICNDAVLRLLTEGTPLEQTIRESRDFTRFVVVRNVKGGAHKGGVYLGKVVRWYYGKGQAGTINYVDGGNKVPNSDGAKPVMDLPRDFPDDINLDWYIAEAKDILEKIGYTPKPKQETLFF